MSASLELMNITKSGGVPESRLNDAPGVHTMVRQLIRADESRAQVRAKVKGLVDGNAPYNAAELRRTGQSYRTNVNFRESESFLGLALSAFYDVFSEVPQYSTVQCAHGDPHERELYSAILTEEFDKLQKQDTGFDYLMQSSQHEMVLYGIGPIMWEDSMDWRCKSIRASDLLVADGTKSNIDDWNVVVVRTRYQVHELYSFIRNEDAASTLGWNVAAARDAIIKAAPASERSSSHDWEYYQQQIRNNDLSYSAQCDAVLAAHVFYREFPTDDNPEGAISHIIIDERGDNKNFLFRRVARYANWRQALQCMYYDKGDGTHHSVKGMGVKMYAAMEIKNRLKCALLDNAFLNSTMVWQATAPDDLNRVSLVQAGPISIVPPGYNVVQRNTAGQIEGPLQIEREVEGLLQSNLSSYRQRLEKQGNPRTATEIEAITAQQSVLGKTQLNRYYEQLDSLFTERYRRASNSKLTKDVPGGAEALKFQKACIERGVPRKAIHDVEWVKATRTVGQGSAASRRSTLSQLLQIVSMLPETGRDSVIRDYISALVGQSNLPRFMPEPAKDYGQQEQEQEAARENALLRLRAPIPVSAADNHVIHSQSHIAFGAEIAQSAQQGADPAEIAGTLQAVVAHVGEHLAGMEGDETRAEVMTTLVSQVKQLAKVAQQAVQYAQKVAEQQAAAQAEMQGISGGSDSKEQLAVMRAQREEARRDAKTQSDMARKQAKTQQDLALKDAKTAAIL